MWGRYVNSKIGFSKYDGFPNFTRLLHESLLKREFDWHDSLLLNASFQRLLMTRFRFTPSLLSIPEVSARLLPDVLCLARTWYDLRLCEETPADTAPKIAAFNVSLLNVVGMKTLRKMTCDCVWQCWPGHQAGSDLQQLRHPL